MYVKGGKLNNHYLFMITFWEVDNVKKILCFITAAAMLGTMIFFGGWASAAPQKTTGEQISEYIPSLPDYEKLDPDLVAERASAGIKAEGKELHGYNGNAYLKPGNYDSLTPVNTSRDKKGIAILVDFPVENTEGRISDVPGVDYPQVPADQFDDMLNGDTYNPYSLPMFNWLAKYGDGDDPTFTKDGGYNTLDEPINAPTDRTLNNYYKEISYGNFSITVDVKGWYTLPHSYEYYLGQNKGYYNDNGDAHVAELVKDAISLAKQHGADFSNYAVPAQPGDFADLYGNATSFKDENGNVINEIVPNIFIIHRGTGAEYSADPSVIWSHKWDLLSAGYFGQYYQTGTYPADSTLKYEVVDGVAVNVYNICPEVGQDITHYYTSPAGLPERPPSPTDPGVFTHEFAHVMGLPDQYDYGYESDGTGMFSNMASGSYGRDIQYRYYSGFCPVHLDAWSKYYLGFIQPGEIKEVKPEDGKKTITLRPVELNKDVVKIVVPGSNGKEYFLLENRQQVGYDKGLAYNDDGSNLHGLTVWHIDENVLARNFHRPNEAANWDWNFRGRNYIDPETGENHYGISVVQADGFFDLEKYNNDGSAGDVFPGKYNVTKLSADIKASPNTTSFYKWGTDSRSYTGITIDNISESMDGIVTFDVYFAK
jgi:M6 family metalloprotease-like protein